MAGRPTDDELREMLRALPRPEPPSGFAQSVMVRVRADARRRRIRPLAARRRRGGAGRLRTPGPVRLDRCAFGERRAAGSRGPGLGPGRRASPCRSRPPGVRGDRPGIPAARRRARDDPATGGRFAGRPDDPDRRQRRSGPVPGPRVLSGPSGPAPGSIPRGPRREPSAPLTDQYPRKRQRRERKEKQ